MDRNRIWTIGAIVLMAAIVAIGWVVAIQPQLDSASAADAQRATVDSTNQANRVALGQLQADSKNLPTLKSQLAALNKSIPTAASVPAFVDEINALAAANGVSVHALTFADAAPYNPVLPVAPAPATTSTSSPTPSPSPTPTAPVAPAGPIGVAPVTSPLITPANFAVIPATVTVDGPNANVLSFLKGVQFGDRLFLVNGFSTTVPSGGTGIEGKISGLIYVLVQPTAAAATK